jgi:pimeloyl-ACP methyl ester carboxylesterase
MSLAAARRLSDEGIKATRSRKGEMTEPTTHTLEVQGAILTYDVRCNEASTDPVLLLIGSPMGASGFPTLASYLTDRTVVTYDPRGVERSTRTDDATESTPDQHADDLHRLISTLNVGAVDVFASSGGAVNALALVAKHPEQVRTLVAHEPPAAQMVPDREYALAASRDIHDTYLRSGHGPAMAKFIGLVGHTGPLTAEYADRPAPDPAMFGMSTEDDGSRTDALVGQNIVSCTHYQFDFDALRAASTRIVIGAGVESEGQLAQRAAMAVAERLGVTPVLFPSGHGGFLGNEYGMPGEPEAFAAKLREALETQA